MKVEDIVKWLGFMLPNECNQVLLLIMLLQLHVVIELPECAFELLPILRCIFIEAFYDFFGWMGYISEDSFKAVIIGEAICIGHEDKFFEEGVDFRIVTRKFSGSLLGVWWR